MKISQNSKGIEIQLAIPQGVQAKVENRKFTAKGKKGEASKIISTPLLKISVEGNKVIIKTDKPSKSMKRFVGTYESHIKNILHGVNDPFVYKLKICSGHFPMNVSATADELVIKNFIGEKFPRKMKIMKGASVKVSADSIVVESCNKEIAGQVAADIENLTKRPYFDTRIFQDGIYIIEKEGIALK